jgi:type I restriction enzyme R subunit
MAAHAAQPPGGKPLRYYQEIAVRRVVQAVLAGRQRILLTMATGTGKTMVAFQICWQLWSSRWNRTGEHRRPRILYLADRNILVDDPKDKTFLPFGDARHKIENGEVVKSREMYFAIYQAIAAMTRAAPALPAVPARLLRPDGRGRVPPRQRPRRLGLA